MTTLGFDNYVEPLKVYLTKYREVTYCSLIFIIIDNIDFLL